MINKVMLIGHLGDDPETGETQRGTRYCKFSLATSRRWRDKTSGERQEKTTWHRVMVWGDHLATPCAQHLRKGSKVFVEGELDVRKFRDAKTGADRWVTEIVVQGFGHRVEFLDSTGGGAIPDAQEPEGFYGGQGDSGHADDRPSMLGA